MLELHRSSAENRGGLESLIYYVLSLLLPRGIRKEKGCLGIHVRYSRVLQPSVNMPQPHMSALGKVARAQPGQCSGGSNGGTIHCGIMVNQPGSPPRCVRRAWKELCTSVLQTVKTKGRRGCHAPMMAVVTPTHPKKDGAVLGARSIPSPLPRFCRAYPLSVRTVLLCREIIPWSPICFPGPFEILLLSFLLGVKNLGQNVF